MYDEDTPKRFYISRLQRKKLIELVRKDPGVLARTSNSVETHAINLKWMQIAKEINKVPGANKDWKRWRKTWQDLRSKTKTRRIEYMRQLRLNKSKKPTIMWDPEDEAIITDLLPDDMRETTDNEDFQLEDVERVCAQENTSSNSPKLIFEEVNVNSPPLSVIKSEMENSRFDHDDYHRRERLPNNITPTAKLIKIKKLNHTFIPPQNNSQPNQKSLNDLLRDKYTLERLHLQELQHLKVKHCCKLQDLEVEKRGIDIEAAKVALEREKVALERERMSLEKGRVELENAKMLLENAKLSQEKGKMDIEERLCRIQNKKQAQNEVFYSGL